MESRPSSGKNSEGNRTTSLPSYSISCTTLSVSASDGQEHNEFDKSRPGAGMNEDDANFSQNGGPPKRSDDLRSISTSYSSGSGHEGGPTSKSVTTRAPSRHNIQQTHTSGQGYVGVFEATVSSLNDDTYGLHNESTGGFNNYLPDARSQTQTYQQSTASMFNEADRNVPNYQSAILWQSQPYQGHLMDSPAIEMCDDNPLSWDTVTTQAEGLSAWGCTLAGIGEHLADYRYQKVTNGEELIIE